MTIEISNISFECTQKKQQYDTKIISTDGEGGGGGEERLWSLKID